MRYAVTFICLMCVSIIGFAQQLPIQQMPRQQAMHGVQDSCSCGPNNPCVYGLTVRISMDVPEGDPAPENDVVWKLQDIPHDLAQKIFQSSINALNEQGVWNYITRALRCEAETTGQITTKEEALMHTFRDLIE